MVENRQKKNREVKLKSIGNIFSEVNTILGRMHERTHIRLTLSIYIYAENHIR